MVAVFAALSLGTNYALIGLPNVKLMDGFIFLAAYLFGLRIGIGVAVSTWAVYGFVNPYGQDDPILLSFLILGECFYVVGAFILRTAASAQDNPDNWEGYARFSFLVGFTGLMATLAYDLLTNFASWLFRTNSLYLAFIIGNVFGAPFSLVHELSNLVLFVTVVPGAIRAARRYTGDRQVAVVAA